MIISYTDIASPAPACWIDGKRGITFNSTTNGLVTAVAEQSGNNTALTLVGNPLYNANPPGILFPSNINANLPTTNGAQYAAIKLPDAFFIDSANSTVLFVVSMLNAVGDANSGSLFTLISSSNGNGNNLYGGDRACMQCTNTFDFSPHHGPPDTHSVGSGLQLLGMSYRGGSVKLYNNGVEYDTGASFGSLGNSGTPKFMIGSTGTTFPTHQGLMVLHDFVVWRKNLSLAEWADAAELASIRWPGIVLGAPKFVSVIEGDSIPFAAGFLWPTSTSPTNGVPSPTHSWPSMVANRLKRRVVNWAYPASQASNYGTASIGNVAVTNPGTGYATAPTITLTVGSGVVATATLSGTGVGSVTVSNQGNGHYTYTPAVCFTGGGGSGAMGHCVMDATGKLVSQIVVDSPGKDYTSAPTVTVHSSSGSGATATATVSGGAITGIAMTANGNAYDVLPDVTISGGGGTGGAAEAGFYFLVGYIETGSGYTVAPTVVVTNSPGDPGQGMALTATTVFDGTISVTITNFGHGYRKPPSISFVGGNGVNARFFVQMGANGSVATNAMRNLPRSIPGVYINERASNDAATGFSGIQAFQNVRNLAAMARAAGMKYVVAQDLLPRGGASPISQTNADQFNQLIGQFNTPGAPLNDGLIDLVVKASDHPLMQNTNDTAANSASGVNVYLDGVHPLTFGHAVVGQAYVDQYGKFAPATSYTVTVPATAKYIAGAVRLAIALDGWAPLGGQTINLTYTGATGPASVTVPQRGTSAFIDVTPTGTPFQVNWSTGGVLGGDGNTGSLTALQLVLSQQQIRDALQLAPTSFGSIPGTSLDGQMISINTAIATLTGSVNNAAAQAALAAAAAARIASVEGSSTAVTDE